MKVICELNRKQYKEMKELYIAFFSSINFNDEYSEHDLKIFAGKKINDIKQKKSNHKYLYVMNEEEIIGFTHGKIVEGIGLICHTYVKSEYQSTMAVTLLLKNLTKWFKDNNIDIMETEISRLNPLIERMEKVGWQVIEEYPDARVFQRKL